MISAAVCALPNPLHAFGMSPYGLRIAIDARITKATSKPMTKSSRNRNLELTSDFIDKKIDATTAKSGTKVANCSKFSRVANGTSAFEIKKIRNVRNIEFKKKTRLNSFGMFV
jgi:hypothetical protein